MKKYFATFISLFLLCTVAFAQSSPLPMLEKTANQLISQLQKNKAKLKTHPQIVTQLVKKLILPHVDQTNMARQVVSRSLWQNASVAQRDAFVDQFKKLVIRTYASAFTNFNNETVKFYPLRRGQANGNFVKINSEILRPNGAPSIPVTYTMTKEDGKWQITDFSVDGVSMVNSFKSQFAGLENDKGLSGLTAILKQHNAKGKHA